MGCGCRQPCVFLLGGMGEGRKVGEGERESAMFGMQLSSLPCSASLCHSYITVNHQNHLFNSFVFSDVFRLVSSDIWELNTRSFHLTAAGS